MLFSWIKYWRHLRGAAIVSDAAGKPHHAADGFRNNYPHAMPGGRDFFRWRWDAWRNKHPRRPAQGYKLPRAQPRVAQRQPGALFIRKKHMQARAIRAAAQTALVNQRILQ